MGGLSSEVAFLSRALKMPRIRQVAPDMAKTARAEGWDPLELLVKVLAAEVTARETHGGENRIRAARFPQTKTLDDFDFAHQRSVSRAQIAHLHQLDFVREAHNVIFLGPPGTTKTHLSIALEGSSSPPGLPSRVRDRHPMGHPTLPEAKTRGMEFPLVAGHSHNERVPAPAMGQRSGKESCWEGNDREESSRMSSNETRWRSSAARASRYGGLLQSGDL